MPTGPRQPIDHLLAIHAAARARVDGRRATRDWLRQHTLTDKPTAPIRCLALGKAACAMAQGAIDELGPQLVAGLVVTKNGHARPVADWPVLEADHPVPGAGSLVAGRACSAFARDCHTGDYFLCLLSGGGSALAEDPRPPWDLPAIARLTDHLLSCGADIGTINRLRSAVSRLKGGGLARTAMPAKQCTLAISDVAGDDPATIASGPTCIAPADDDLQAAAKAMAVPADLRHLFSQLATETLPTGPGGPIHIIGDNASARRAAAETAAAAGQPAVILSELLSGEVTDCAADLHRAATALPIGGILIAGGEPTVQLPGDHGRGGRAQQLALELARLWQDDRRWLALCGGTDGTDGPTDANGAWADGQSWHRAHAMGHDPAMHRQRCDAYPLFAALDQLLITGPTDTNVMDLILIERVS